MKTSELRKLSEEELKAKLTQVRRELFDTKFQISTGQVQKKSQTKGLRHGIARILTLIGEKQAAGAK